MNRLVALSYSPWSEKARWALLHHGVPFREIEYVPILGTPWLRWVARRASGRVTVPTLLIVGGEDDVVIDLNRQALSRLRCIKDLIVIPRATHLFSEPGALEEVARLAKQWFVRFLRAPAASRRMEAPGAQLS